MSKKLNLIGFLLLFNATIIYGQTTISAEKTTPVSVQYQDTKLKKFNSDSKTIENKQESEWKTFEFISLDGEKEVFNKEIIPMLEKMRKENEDVYYQISVHTKIKILSKSFINSEDFKKSINKL